MKDSPAPRTAFIPRWCASSGAWRTPFIVAMVAGAALAAAPRPTAAQTSCRNVAIRSPFGGQTVRGLVPILGSARIDGFGFYKLEWARPTDPETWSAVSMTRPQAVVNGLLDEWDTARLPDGPYRLKLTVVDIQGQEPCRVTVDNVSVATHTTPTATPPYPSAPGEIASDVEAVASPTLIGQPTATGALPADATPGVTATAPLTSTPRPSVTPLPTRPPSPTPTPIGLTETVVAPAPPFTPSVPAVTPVPATATGTANGDLVGDGGASPAPGNTSGGGLDEVTLDLLAPSSWLAVLAAGGLRQAFLWGAGASLLVALAALLVIGVRRRR
jgi:hypothetical protein